MLMLSVRESFAKKLSLLPLPPSYQSLFILCPPAVGCRFPRPKQRFHTRPAEARKKACHFSDETVLYVNMCVCVNCVCVFVCDCHVGVSLNGTSATHYTAEQHHFPASEAACFFIPSRFPRISPPASWLTLSTLRCGIFFACIRCRAYGATGRCRLTRPSPLSCTRMHKRPCASETPTLQRVTSCRSPTNSPPCPSEGV